MSLNKTEDGTLMLRPKAARKKYSAKELNALCDFNAPMPADLQVWDKIDRVSATSNYRRSDEKTKGSVPF